MYILAILKIMVILLAEIYRIILNSLEWISCQKYIKLSYYFSLIECYLMFSVRQRVEFAPFKAIFKGYRLILTDRVSMTLLKRVL